MEQLELKHLAPYLPYGLKMLIKFPAMEEFGELKALGLHPGTGKEERITLYLNTSSERGRQVILSKNPTKNIVKPLLLSLSELLNIDWIAIFQAGFDALSTPIPDKCFGTYHLELHDHAAELLINDSGDSVSFDFKEKQFDGHGIRFNQRAAFEKIYELHGDIDGLLEAGLALNKLDYPNN